MNTAENSTSVLILTRQYRIQGRISLIPEARITDFMKEADSFFAVTDATVFTQEGTYVLSATYLDVNRDAIEVIVPSDVISAERNRVQPPTGRVSL